MPGESAIEWTEVTWNPVTGCTKVSPGCAHCYAETFAERWRGIPGHAYEQGFDLKLWPQRLEIPLRWKRPRMVFVNSMSDLFHEDVPDDFIAQVFGVMAAAEQHTFQVLTKRPERMRALVSRLAVCGGFERHWGIGDTPYCTKPHGSGQHMSWTFRLEPLPNVWLGVTIENRRFVHRADLLRQTPAAVRFISAEPLLGPLLYDDPDAPGHWRDSTDWWNPRPELDVDGIDWLICGGESGPGCRRFDLDWARHLRDRCEIHGVAFFLKQLGGYPNKRGGDQALLDGRRHTAMPRVAVSA